MKKVILAGRGLGIASHIAHSSTITHEPIIFPLNTEEEKGIKITEELPQLIQNIIDDSEKFKLTEYDSLTPLSGREKRRQRRKQERKRKQL